jgi:lactate dehydrogenase-like 2-hydroxyacid dehydrogenase
MEESGGRRLRGAGMGKIGWIVERKAERYYTFTVLTAARQSWKLKP